MLDINPKANPNAQASTPQTPQQKQGINVQRAFDFSVFFIVLVCIIFIVATGGLYFWSKGRENVIKDQDSKIASYEKDLKDGQYAEINQKAKEVSTQVTEVKKILAGNYYWSKFFKEFRNRTPKEVKYTSFAITEKGDITISGETGSYDGIIKTLVSFRDSKNFSNIQLNSSACNKKPSQPVVCKFSINVGLNVTALMSTDTTGTEAGTESETEAPTPSE